MTHIALATITMLLWLPAIGSASEFATEVVSSTGPFGGIPYDDPQAVLGRPSTVIYDEGFPPFIPSGTYTPSLVYGAAFTDPDDGKLVTTINEGAEIVVKFDHKVIDHPGNWYGQDFTVYGNAFFEVEGAVTPDMDMAARTVTTGLPFAERVLVSVSSDGANWYTYNEGPFGDDTYPTNPFAWDRAAGDWGEALDWTKPVNPALSAADFAGHTVADGIDLYDGSAGGTSFDLTEATGLDTISVTLLGGEIVPCKYIQYVKVSGEGEIDGFTDVAVRGDQALIPGDANGDGFVDDIDLGVLLGNWNSGTLWELGNFDGIGAADDSDLSVLLGNWTGPPPPGGGQVVPEPTSLALCGAAAVWGLRRKGPRSRRRRHR